MALVPQGFGPRVGGPGNLAAPVAGQTATADAWARLAQSVAGSTNKVLDQQAAYDGRAAGQQAGAEAGTTGKPLALSDRPTIAGHAFDAAAIAAWDGKVTIRLNEEVLAAVEAHGDNPKALGDAFDGLHKWLVDGAPSWLTTGQEQSLQRLRQSYMREALEKNERNQIARAAGVLPEKFRAIAAGLEQLSYNARSSQELADAENAANAEFVKTIERHGPKGGFSFNGVDYPADKTRIEALTPAMMAQLWERQQERGRWAVIDGRFSRYGTIEEKQAYRDSLLADWAQRQTGVSLEERDKTLARLDNRIADLRAGQNAVRTQQLGFLREKRQLMELGHEVSPEEMMRAAHAAAAAGDPVLATQFERSAAAATITNDMRRAPPEQMDAWLAGARQRQASHPSPALDAQIETVEQLRANAAKGLKDDPLEYASRVGVVTLGRLDLASPETAAKTGQQRRADAMRAEAYYGRAMPLLQAREQNRLVEMWGRGSPDKRATLISNFRVAFGDRADEALSAIAPRQPDLAWLAALSRYPGGTAVVRDAMDGQAAIAGKVVPLPAREVLDRQTGDLRGAFRYKPTWMLDSVLDTTNALYASALLRKGSTEFDEDVYDLSLHRALGGGFNIKGERTGGVGDWRGEPLILPTGVTQKDFRRRMKTMDAHALKKAGGGVLPMWRAGEMVDDLRGLYLIPLSENRYLLAHDAAGVQRVGRSDGRKRADGSRENYVLDFSKLPPEKEGE